MSSNKEIFINSSVGGNRIAILEDRELVELFIDTADHRRMVGNIYKGRIQNVIPGMQAAFIDIGYEINAFLPFSEIGNSDNMKNLSFDDNDKKQTKSSRKQIEKTLKINEDILVQVIKEPFSGKGPRVTTDISIPGSLMVLVPNENYIGISRKIADKYEKRRLRKIADNFRPDNFGLIIRTIAEGMDEKDIESDFNQLWETWKSLESKINTKKSPYVVYKDFDTSEQVVRDLFKPDISKLYIDNKTIYKKIKKYLKKINHKNIDNVNLIPPNKYIFDTNNIEQQINKCFKRKVWMKSGAHLYIEHTEAMLVIDVNSGRYIGKKDHETNSLQINLEASKEVARQLRLRDIGGLIVIDFIDLQDQKNRKKVILELKKHLKKDRAKVSLTEFSNFGLLEMTRQRIRLDLVHTYKEECTTCNGSGLILSKESMLIKIETWIKKFKVKFRDKRLIIYMHPSEANYILKEKKSFTRNLMFKNWILIKIKSNPELSLNNFIVYSKKQRKEVTSDV
ncbi:MAG: ribonuclease G [Candidatus Marinimicrobia bacterium]|nr:ribonuclease G [Candidatus Neomarinimicrobiota bacterium]|tara:strand:- start:2159 stop:3682 length:1524 start_codon:yes stop_codon:yes gene_type:complete